MYEDCDDGDASVYPFAGDTYGDGIDSDCDGLDCEATWSGTTYFAACQSAAYSSFDASLLCTSGGHDGLATILNSSENSFLLGLRPVTAYYYKFGLTDAASEGAWVWESGLPLTYTDWGPSEPNGGTGENCALVFGSNHGYSAMRNRWGDASCTPPEPAFFCETR